MSQLGVDEMAFPWYIMRMTIFWFADKLLEIAIGLR